MLLQNNPRCVINFYTSDKKNYVIDETITDYNSSVKKDIFSIGFTNSLISCTTSKKLGDPYGTFQIKLAYIINDDGETWLDILRPNQLVVIRMSGGTADQVDWKKQPPVVMMGLIDEITEEVNYENATRSISVQGADLGKTLADAKVYYYYFEDFKSKLLKNLADDKFVWTYGKIENILQQAIENYFFKQFDLSFNIGGSVVALKDLMGYKLNWTEGQIITPNDMFLPETNMWEVLKTYANAPFNELFFDTLSEKEASRYVAPLNAEPESYSLSESVAFTGSNSFINSGTADYSTANFDLGSAFSGIGALKKIRGPVNWRTNKNIQTQFGAQGYLILRPTPFISSTYGDKNRTLNAVEKPLNQLGVENKNVGGLNGIVARLWYDLPTFYLKKEDILEDNTSFGAHEAYNYFSTTLEFLEGVVGSTTGEEPLSYYDIYNYKHIAKYGLNQLKADLKTMPISADSNGVPLDYNTASLDTAIALGKSYVAEDVFLGGHIRMLHDWFIYNTEYKSGTINIQGNPVPKIGTRLVNENIVNVAKKDNKGIRKQKWNYYIQSVQNAFVKYQNYRTQLQVIRGFDENDILMSPDVVNGDAYNKFKPSTGRYLEDRLDVNTDKDFITDIDGAVYRTGAASKPVKKHSQDGFKALQAINGWDRYLLSTVASNSEELKASFEPAPNAKAKTGRYRLVLESPGDIASSVSDGDTFYVSKVYNPKNPKVNLTTVWNIELASNKKAQDPKNPKKLITLKSPIRGIRFENIDAPEIHDPNGAPLREKDLGSQVSRALLALGKEAKTQLIYFLTTHSAPTWALWVENPYVDLYNRLVGQVIATNGVIEVNLNEYLYSKTTVMNGKTVHIVKYAGNKHRQPWTASDVGL